MTAKIDSALVSTLVDVISSKKVRVDDRLAMVDRLADIYGTAGVECPADLAEIRQAIRPRKAGVCEYIRGLLLDPALSYQDIVDMARAEFPGSAPTAKSCASLARDMRRDGVEVPHRGQTAKPRTDEKIARLLQACAKPASESDLSDALDELYAE